MKPREPRESGQHDMFRSRLDQILDMGHEKVILSDKIDWQFLSDRMGGVYTDGPGHPPLSNRLMAGLHILKYAEDLSDDEVCARWLENPYYQYFCGEEFFCHSLPLDRSSMTRWRQRMGEDRLNALLQESLAVAVKVGAAKPVDFTRAVIDTTVAEKDVAFPTDAKLIHKARERLVKQAKRAGIDLRQSYTRVGKRTLIAPTLCPRQTVQAGQSSAQEAQDVPRSHHPRHWAQDQRRCGAGGAFLRPLWLGERVMTQKKRDPLPKIYALHAPEVECIGKGKAHKPYEFGVKVSVATTLNRCKGGQFAIHAKALPGRPCDGHTLETVIPEIEDLTGATLKRILADAGYRGHNAPGVYKLRVFTAGQKRRVTPAIKRQMKRRSAVEPVIGHIKNDHRMDRNRLAHAQGDAINPILAAAGYNFRLILKWIRLLLSLLWIASSPNYQTHSRKITA